MEQLAAPRRVDGPLSLSGLGFRGYNLTLILPVRHNPTPSAKSQKWENRPINLALPVLHIVLLSHNIIESTALNPLPLP